MTIKATAFVCPPSLIKPSGAVKNMNHDQESWAQQKAIFSPIATTTTTARVGETSQLNMINRKWWDSDPDAPALLVAALVGGFLLLLSTSTSTIGSSEVGIKSTLGKLSQLDPGLHVVVPVLSKVDRLSTKTQLLEQSNFVPTKEGLTVELDTAILYRIDPESSVELYRTVGTNYANTIVAPQASSVIRGLTAEAEAKALYTSGRTAIQSKIKTDLDVDLRRRGIIVEDVLLKAIQLPDELSKSIEQKARAEQDSARMEFVLTKEKQEAERKAIEAKGIADFQTIVSSGISPNVLKWKGIEATEKLAESPNAKIIVIGNAKDGLPIILGGDSAK